jgi:hypothetical protein
MMSGRDEKRSHSVKMGGWWLYNMPRQAYVMVCALVALQIAMAVKLEGGSAVAMAGRGCVVLAMDNRVGTQYVKTPRSNHGCHSITEDQYTHTKKEHKSRHRVKSGLRLYDMVLQCRCMLADIFIMSPSCTTTICTGASWSQRALLRLGVGCSRFTAVLLWVWSGTTPMLWLFTSCFVPS